MARNNRFGAAIGHALPQWPTRLVQHLGLWIAPPLATVSRLAPRRRPLSGGEPGGAPLERTLAPIAVRLRLVWWLTVLRRALIVGVVVGLIAALLSYGFGWDSRFGVAITLVTALLAALVNARRTPDTVAVARYVDQELDLKERIGTALEFEGSRHSHSSLQGLVERSGSEAATDAARAWSALPRAHRGEWLVLAVLIALLAGLVSAPVAADSPQRPALVANRPAIVTNQPVIEPTLPAGAKPISVQVALVSTPAVDDSHAPAPAGPRTSATVNPKPSPGVTGRAGTPTPTPPSSAQEPQAPPGVSGKNTFLALSPTTGQSKANSSTGPAGKTNAAPGSTNAGGKTTPSGAPPAGATVGTGKSQSGRGGASANQSGGKSGNNKTGGSSSSGTPKTQQCNLDGCTKANPNQVAKPGSITGSGQIVGGSKTGGKTSGTGAGSTTKGHSTTAKTPSPTHQLNITSPYGPTGSRVSSTKQVQDHNGAGSSAQSAALAGTTGSPTIDYVPPDDNVVSPEDRASVGRYFTPQTGQSGTKSP